MSERKLRDERDEFETNVVRRVRWAEYTVVVARAREEVREETGYATRGCREWTFILDSRGCPSRGVLVERLN